MDQDPAVTIPVSLLVLSESRRAYPECQVTPSVRTVVFTVFIKTFLLSLRKICLFLSTSRLLSPPRSSQVSLKGTPWLKLRSGRFYLIVSFLIHDTGLPSFILGYITRERYAGREVSRP